MTKQHWIILGALGLAVLCLYCVGAVLVLQMLSAPAATQIVTALEATPTSAPIAPATNAPSVVAQPSTPQPTARPSATWVLAPLPAQTGATSVGTRASTPFAPPSTAPFGSAQGMAQSATPGATATRRPTIQPVGPIMTAWSKAQSVTTYRIEFDWTIKGNVSDMPPGWDIAKGMPLFGIAGTLVGKDSQIAFKGIMAVLFTGDPTKSVEFLTIGNQTYIRGPAPMLGAPENKWYTSSGQGTFSTNMNEGISDMPDDPTIDWGSFKKTATETFDGKRCDVYSGDKNATLKLFQSVNAKETTSKQSLDTIDNAETKFWICDDGYLHQWTMNVDGRNKDKPTDKVSFQIRLHLWDFNANIKLTPPANPAPLQMPSFDFGFATPTTKPK
jgi:hypothetical protein